MTATEQRIEELVRQQVREELREFRRRTTIVAFSGEMDRLFAALSIASASAACGLESTVFFTFWGLAALRKPDAGGTPEAGPVKKKWLDRILGAAIPAGCARLPVSAMNFGGAGAAFFRWLMRRRNVQSPQDVLLNAQALGVRLIACQMSLQVLGLSREELIEGVEIGGAATFVRDAAESTVTLFV